MAKGDKTPRLPARCAWLMDLSKAALADLVYDLGGALAESCDDPESVNDAIIDYVKRICEIRGDRMPRLAKAFDYALAAQIRKGK